MKYLVLLALFSISCTKKHENPEDVLERFVKIRFEQVLNRITIKDYLAGKILEKFNKYKDSEFSSLHQKELKLQDVKIIHKNCQTSKCFLTYIVKYKKYENNKKVLIAETKKIAQVEKIDNQWRIIDVNNIKTYYQSKKEIIINQSTAK